MTKLIEDRDYISLSAVVLNKSSVIFALSIFSGLIFWNAISLTFGLVETIGTPAIVFEHTINLYQEGKLIPNIVVTLHRTALAMVGTILLGTLLGILAGSNEFWGIVGQNWFLTAMSLPSLLAAVFAAIWFGIGFWAPVVAGFILAFPYLAQNVKQSVENIDNDLIIMSKSYNVSSGRMIRRVVIQSILPHWFSGFRNSFTVAWKVVTLGEFVASENGVGYQIGIAASYLSMKGILAWTFTFTVIALIIEYGVLQRIERHVFEWRDTISVGGGVA